VTAIQSEYDCIVVGGGPAGSTVAALVADAGFQTLLLEREQHPRLHVGESLMPETYWVFERLGFLEKMKQSHFTLKVGAQFVNNTGRDSQPFIFRTHDPRESSDTWHVDRGEFDKLMFEHAAELGADCRDGIRVLDVTFDGRRATGVVVPADDSANGKGTTRTIAAKVVVDATGQQALLSNKLNVRRVDPRLRKAAIWGHFRGAKRETVVRGGVNIIILFTRSGKAWFWYIPQANDITSVGVVGDNDYLLKGRGTPQETFAQELAECPGVADRLAQAESACPLMVVKEFSYSTDQSAGDGWVLVGDAWGFIDPIYSSGVFFALKSGELAADCIIDGLRKGDTSAAQLGKWEPEFRAGTEWVRKLVESYYSGHFRVGKFVREYPQHISSITDLLIGRVFKPGVGAVFDDLEPWLRERAKATVDE
jgi:flavin-dependent dehydrogenase